MKELKEFEENLRVKEEISVGNGKRKRRASRVAERANAGG